ncbi:hypothetical protein [Actinoalloteichus hymeniacidonis]|uniref:Uncharacterized protein n=1 Tax=Actinoalloteichus hymeniacidonis TaxID=340345 RepID=A0AAC9N124_9PSEU|nr:hypothetical protein [Actinoalloteichus hymeniacidonis]AOS65446.1 hypothetical protein TL08_23330 [Actinoalloteichus hymeniacidonis]MBB5906467.1 hypothetical protein [Actinoalloteichus hymeniacidonis]
MTQPGEAREPMLDIAGGDEARSRRLMRTVKAARDSAADPALRALLEDVVAGKKGLREIAGTEAFGRAAAPAINRFAEIYQNLSDEERAAAEEEGRRQEDEIQREIDEEKRAAMSGPPVPHPSTPPGAPPLRRPSRRRDDDEDDDFSENTFLR